MSSDNAMVQISDTHLLSVLENGDYPARSKSALHARGDFFGEALNEAYEPNRLAVRRPNPRTDPSHPSGCSGGRGSVGSFAARYSRFQMLQFGWPSHPQPDQTGREVGSASGATRSWGVCHLWHGLPVPSTVSNLRRR